MIINPFLKEPRFFPYVTYTKTNIVSRVCPISVGFLHEVFESKNDYSRLKINGLMIEFEGNALHQMTCTI